MRPHTLPVLACLLWALPAAADELPTRKPGLWELKMFFGGREAPLQNIQQCTDAETDALMTTNFGGGVSDRCDKPKVSRTGDAYTVDSRCRIGGTTVTTRAVISGDFDSAYTVKVTAPEGGARGDDRAMTMQAKWTGPCRQGLRPGDIVMPGGFKINVRELSVGAGPPRR
jgi:hypothetical protein